MFVVVYGIHTSSLVRRCLYSVKMVTEVNSWVVRVIPLVSVVVAVVMRSVLPVGVW